MKGLAITNQSTFKDFGLEVLLVPHSGFKGNLLPLKYVDKNDGKLTVDGLTYDWFLARHDGLTTNTHDVNTPILETR